MKSWLEDPIDGVLLDITGCLYESGEGMGTVIQGSVDAVRRIKQLGIPVRLVTNETCATRAEIVAKLKTHGYDVTEEDIFSPVPAILTILRDEGLSPHLLVHRGIEEEFKEVINGSPTCVVVGDADEAFSYENMNKAFRALMKMDEPRLFSLGYGRYYKHKGELTLDVGAFVNALEFACDIESVVIGKPSKQFFEAALSDMGVTADRAVMIGDDIVSDVGGAQKCGIRGVLVQTGKFTSKNLSHKIKPDCIAANLFAAAAMIASAANNRKK